MSCCTPKPMAVFRKESLVTVIEIHTGLDCWAKKEEVSPKEWLSRPRVASKAKPR